MKYFIGWTSLIYTIDNDLITKLLYLQDLDNPLTSSAQNPEIPCKKTGTVKGSNTNETNAYLDHNPNGTGAASSSCQSSPSKYQIPSSIIVLSKQEEAELRDVIMQMTLRDCGL